jgi:hypothetical protein
MAERCLIERLHAFRRHCDFHATDLKQRHRAKIDIRVAGHRACRPDFSITKLLDLERPAERHDVFGAAADGISEVDLGVNLATTIQVMANNASIGAYGSEGEYEPRFPLLAFIFKDVNIRFVQCSLMPLALREEGTKRVTQWCREGKMVHAIDCQRDRDVRFSSEDRK